MFAKKNTVYSVIFSLISLSACATSPTTPVSVSNIEPEFVRLGHAETVTITLNSDASDWQASLLAGGPYIQARTQLDNTATGLAVTDDATWLIENKKGVIGYRFDSQQYQAFSQLTFTGSASLIDARNGLLYVADDAPSLVTIDVRDANSPRKIDELLFSVPVTHLSASDTRICAVSGPSLYSVNVDFNGQFISPVSQYSLPEPIKQIKASDASCVLLTHNGLKEVRFSPAGTAELSKNFSARYAHAIDAQQHPYALANGQYGITLVAEDGSNSFQWQGSYNKLGHIQQIARDGDRVVSVDTEGTLTLLDISHPETPLLLADFRLPAAPTHVWLQDKILTAIVENALIRVDFSSESSPAISTLGVNLGGSRRSFIRDDILYVADWFSGVHLYDITIPHAPRLISSLHTPGSPKGIWVDDQHIAYIADDDKGLLVADVSEPRRPAVIGHLDLPGLAYTMKLRGNQLYLASHSGGFHIIDVSNPRHPKRLGGVDTPGKSWALDLVGNTLFVADDDSGILVFDVSQPATPALISQYLTDGHAEDIVIRDNLAFVAVFEQGLQVLDISNPASIQRVSQLNTPGNARGIKIDQDHLYLASWRAGVQLIDISDPTSPQAVALHDTAGATWGVELDHDYLYALDWWGGVRVLERQPPLEEIAQYQAASPINRLAIYEHFALTASNARGLQIFDISNTLNPMWSTAVDFDGYAKDVITIDQYALVAAAEQGLVIVDLSNPFQAHWLSQHPLSHSADQLVLHDKTLFVMTQNGPITAFNLRTPNQPQRIAYWPKPAQTMLLSEKTLAVQTDLKQFSLRNVDNLTKIDDVSKWQLSDPCHLAALSTQYLVCLETGKGITLYQRDSLTLNKVDFYEFTEPAKAIQLTHDQLTLSVAHHGFYRFKLSSDGQIAANDFYPTTHAISHFAFYEDAVFFAGEHVLASATLLPATPSQANGNRIRLSLAASLPAGSYSVLLHNSAGEHILLRNKIKIDLAKPKKPAFSLEDLKRIMQQENFDGKAPK